MHHEPRLTQAFASPSISHFSDEEVTPSAGTVATASLPDRSSPALTSTQTRPTHTAFGSVDVDAVVSPLSPAPPAGKVAVWRWPALALGTLLAASSEVPEPPSEAPRIELGDADWLARRRRVRRGWCASASASASANVNVSSGAAKIGLEWSNRNPATLTWISEFEIEFEFELELDFDFHCHSDERPARLQVASRLSR